ncbi:hypothetical protein [Methylobacterium nodulans]|uniref:Uncharacterized protein n=1 Tax=Methylobacterium nodulans (strain LMG 21967 / CNCM I-2342 / ORS 2060) TaxID=460265 RepID=B8IF06_METNO|nr:hypothetical protein [Methylobacterium nodulans]ACL55717.1 conserved hypothetical protein [Methylobacterium nodulans ORS 2060]
MSDSDSFLPPDLSDQEAKRAALTYVSEAFAEGCLDGIDGDCMAQAALFAAFQELVQTYGEEATARYAEGFPDRIRSGAYTVNPVPRH